MLVITLITMGQKEQLQVLCAAAAFAVFAAILGNYVFKTGLKGESLILLFSSGLGTILSMVCFVVCIHIWSLNPADSHTLKTLFSQYTSYVRLRLTAIYLTRLIEEKTKDPKKVNEEALMKILRLNQDSSYGKEYKFAEMRSREDFVKGHPVTTHDHFKPYVARIVNGEKKVLHSPETTFLVHTSGTTGTSKIYPYTSEYSSEVGYILRTFYQSTILHLYNLQRYAQFHIFSAVRKSPAGIPIGAGLQALFQFPEHNLIPRAYSKLHEEDASYYVQAVFSLAERELRYISGFSSDLMYSYMKFINKHWDHICEDIGRGEIGKHINMPENVRAELSECFQPDLRRASDLKQAMKVGIVGLAKRVWPSMEFILMGKSAAFKMCADMLAENQFKGIKIIDYAHGATEGVTGLNLEGDQAHMENIFTFIPFISFFYEFIPLENVEDESPPTLFLDQLKIGQMYEVVKTNSTGLYRCRYGDVIKVVGFRNKTPKYMFMYRLGQRLNVAYERTPDKILLEAIEMANGNMSSDVKLVNYTTTESMALEKITGNTSKGHYVFFMEFADNEAIDHQGFAKQIDDTLLQIHEQYKRFKVIDSIGPLEIIPVKRGTFEGLKTFIWNDTPHGQFKMPRVLRKEPALRFLLSQAV